MSAEKERQAFAEALARDGQDRPTRLVFAAWLREHGEDELADELRGPGLVVLGYAGPRLGPTWHVVIVATNQGELSEGQAVKPHLTDWKVEK